MPIFVTCPQCGRTLQGREQDAGKQTKCPACWHVLTLPEHGEPPPVSTGPVGWSQQPERASSVPAAGMAASPSVPQLYTCRVCNGGFPVDRVYDQDGSIICHRCFNEDQGRGYSGGFPRRRFREDSGGPRPHVDSYRTEAILCTIFGALSGLMHWVGFLSLVFGILAIVKASRVEAALSAGKYQQAADDSKAASAWCLLSFIILLGAVAAAFAVVVFAPGPVRF